MFNIEEELFISYKSDIKKLKKYGFREVDGTFKFEKNIMDDSFKVEIAISKDKKVNLKVIDNAFGDEYTNFRMEENQGEFVARVRENIQSILLDIRDNCYQKEQFEYDQTLRIVNLIKEKYGDVPDFEWMDDPTCGAIKHKDTLKWYGLIMGIDYSKLEEDKKGYIEVINLKIDDKKIPDLVHENGIYPAYHMNKKYWITVTMDDKQEDSSIMKLIDESYQFAANGKKVRKGTTNEWIVPANPKYYDLIKDFKGKKAIAGGTTANLISRELNIPITMDTTISIGKLPSCSYMDGVDLVTEGILTLTQTLEYLESGEWDIDNAAGKLVKFLLDSDCIYFMVGAKLNQAHYNPNMPIEIEIRKNIIKKMKNVLQDKYYKNVSVQYI
jgi:predicted DNA-binding protein (MmcQ/YjbR family)